MGMVSNTYALSFLNREYIFAIAIIFLWFPLSKDMGTNNTPSNIFYHCLGQAMIGTFNMFTIFSKQLSMQRVNVPDQMLPRLETSANCVQNTCRRPPAYLSVKPGLSPTRPTLAKPLTSPVIVFSFVKNRKGNLIDSAENHRNCLYVRNRMMSIMHTHIHTYLYQVSITSLLSPCSLMQNSYISWVSLHVAPFTNVD